MMTDATAARLERLRNRSTLYEASLWNPATGRHFLLGYMPKSRAAMLRAIHRNCERLAAFAKADRVFDAKTPGALFTIGDYRLSFTGRTEREAVGGGELPFFAPLVQEGN